MKETNNKKEMDLKDATILYKCMSRGNKHQQTRYLFCSAAESLASRR
jgi:hypothetical protein